MKRDDAGNQNPLCTTTNKFYMAEAKFGFLGKVQRMVLVRRQRKVFRERRLHS
jgi:hypothetical protein